jgi:hypothetical protein
VAGDREPDDADAVQRAAAFGHVGDREVAPTLGNEHRVHRVVDAAGAAKTEHIPVVDQVDGLDRGDEDPRFAGLFDDAERVDMGGVLEP